MTNQDYNPDNMDNLLKEIYNEQPPDSWGSLRNRIESRIEKDSLIQTPKKEPLFRTLTFWRFLSLSMAACLLLMAGLLIFQDTRQKRNTPALLSHRDIRHLSDAFGQIRELFQDQTPWFAVGPGEKTSIGLNRNQDTSGQQHDIVILRLVLHSTKGTQADDYYDVVTYINKKASIQLTLENSNPVLISVTPLRINNGQIEISYEAQMDGNTILRDKHFIAGNIYTPLANIPTGIGSANIVGTGYVITKL
jgi:hypothetical protein